MMVTEEALEHVPVFVEAVTPEVAAGEVARALQLLLDEGFRDSCRQPGMLLDQ